MGGTAAPLRRSERGAAARIPGVGKGAGSFKEASIVVLFQLVHEPFLKGHPGVKFQPRCLVMSRQGALDQGSEFLLGIPEPGNANIDELEAVAAVEFVRGV